MHANQSVFSYIDDAYWFLLTPKIAYIFYQDIKVLCIVFLHITFFTPLELSFLCMMGHRI